MNPEVKFQQADRDLPFPRGVEETGRKSLALPFLASARKWQPPWKEIVGPVFPWKALFQKKAGKPLLFFSLQNGVNGLRVRTGVLLRKVVDSHASPVTVGTAPWFLLVPLQTVAQLCTALYLWQCAISVQLQPALSPQMQRRQHRGKWWEVETNIIFPFPVAFQLKVEPSPPTKSYMCRRHFSREDINTSHKHLWMDESHEKDSQHNQFSHKRNLKSPGWCIWETRKCIC